MATLSLLTGMTLIGLDFMGVGPNLGLPVGYYGRFNGVLARIQAASEIEVIRTSLHRDLELEDFYILVRLPDRREVQLCFEGANTRPFSELLEELKKIGL
ncbi:MAG: hypothetical protein R3F29_13705 [Planctomycetota bacterium]